MIDTRPARLATLRQQAERLEPWERDVVVDAFDTADLFLEDVDRVGRERFRPEREEEEIATARQTAVAGFASVFEAIDAAVALERERVVDVFDGDRATRVRENRRLADVVDTDALLNADSPRVVRNIVSTADVYGVGAEARALALRTVKPKAATEQRTGRQDGAGWFSLLVWLTNAGPTATDRHELGARVDGRRDVLRRLVRDVADVVGVAAGLARESATPAPMPDDVNVKPTMTVGRWWDLNPQFRR
jgi:hypothetical protein